MKKIILLLLSFFIIENVQAYDLSDAFYYNDEKVENMWITKVIDNEILSGVPFILKRVSDNSFVYCIEPAIMMKQGEKYFGYYELNDKFPISENDLKRISLIANFGYLYPGHKDIKWYGITQYMIWKTVIKDGEIYFTDTRYGNKIDIYKDEIAEIEYLISEYLNLLEFDKQKIVFNNIEDFIKWQKSNIFLFDITIDSKQNIIIPITNTNKMEILFYHETGQNVYLPGKLEISDISFEVEFVKDIIIRKWYGSGKYELEEGAIFEIYKNNKLMNTIATDKHGIIHLTLPYGTYKIVQVSGIEGYSFVEPFELNIGLDYLNELIELYNEAKVVKVPDTSKNISYILLCLPIIFLLRKKLC